MPPFKAITIPELGMTTDEVVIAQWWKQPGERVERGEPIVELVTDKASMDLEATDAGTVFEVLVAAGETIPVNTVIGRLDLGLEDGVVPAPSAQAPAPPEVPAPAPAPPSAGDTVPSDGGGRVRATPVARRMARHHGLNLHEIEGSGPRGRIRRTDVESTLADTAGHPAPSAPTPVVDAAPPAGRRVAGRSRGSRVIALSDRQRRLATHLARSAAVPQFSVARDIDLTSVLSVPKDDGGPSFSDVLIKAVAMTLRDHRQLNASMDDGELIAWDDINIGMAVAVGPDLHVPVIRSADTRPMKEIAEDRRELTQRARAGSMEMADGADGTFTISNMGTLGITDVQAIVTPPQVAILGVGAPVARVVPTARWTDVRQFASFRMTCDHRAVNGAAAAWFLADLAARLSTPFTIAEA